MLENAQKRDIEYQRMLRDNEKRIIGFMDTNKSLQEQIDIKVIH